MAMRNFGWTNDPLLEKLKEIRRAHSELEHERNLLIFEAELNSDG